MINPNIKYICKELKKQYPEVSYEKIMDLVKTLFGFSDASSQWISDLDDSIFNNLSLKVLKIKEDMKMKVYAVNIQNEMVPKLTEINQDLGIRIEHKGVKYTLSEDNSGELIFRSIDNTQLILHPKAANSVEIKSK